jgi:hypothetical protein
MAQNPYRGDVEVANAPAPLPRTTTKRMMHYLRVDEDARVIDIAETGPRGDVY